MIIDFRFNFFHLILSQLTSMNYRLNMFKAGIIGFYWVFLGFKSAPQFVQKLAL